MTTKILIIEDNKGNLEVILYLLRQYGYKLITAENGKDGIKLAKQEMPDLIISDIQLPQLNGYEVARALKSDTNLKKIPLVAVTAYAMEEDEEKILSAGYNAYIAKPIDPEEFVCLIEKELPLKLRLSKQKKFSD